MGKNRKLKLNRETLRKLDAPQLRGVAGALSELKGCPPRLVPPFLYAGGSVDCPQGTSQSRCVNWCEPTHGDGFCSHAFCP